MTKLSANVRNARLRFYVPVSTQEVEVPRQEVECFLTPLGIIPKVLLHVGNQLVVYSHPATNRIKAFTPQARQYQSLTQLSVDGS